MTRRSAPGTGRPAVDPLISATVESRMAVADRDGQHDLLTVRLHGRALRRIVRWEVDPDHDGRAFRPADPRPSGADAETQDEGRSAGGGLTATFAVDTHDGPRTVCVRVVDVDGTRSEHVVAMPSRGFP